MNKFISFLLWCFVCIQVTVSDSGVLDATARADQRSLLIIFDGTGSMGSNLAQVKSAAEEIVNELSKRKDNPIFNYILVVFRDPDIEPALVTTDPQIMLQKLNNVVVGGGDDCPEMALGGLKEGLKYALQNSIAFVITDATAKDHSEYRSVLNTMQKKQISATFLSTGNCGDRNSQGYKVYKKLSRFTNGQVFDMKSDGITEVILAIRTQLDDDFTTLQYVTKNAAGTSIEEFSVDSTITEIQIILSGSNPSMIIRNPHGEIITGKLTSMANVMIVKISNPVPGKWTVEAKSSSAHSIRFGAISSLKVDYGFSINTPTKPSQTSKSPAKGEKNVLAVFVPDSSAVADLTEIVLELQEMDEIDARRKRELSGSRSISSKLKMVNRNMYVTNPFKCEADQMFKIVLVGTDKLGYPVERLFSNSIQCD